MSGAPYWPVYAAEDPQIITFDANVTSLAYVEADTYRAEGIDFLSTRVLTTQGII